MTRWVVLAVAAAALASCGNTQASPALHLSPTPSPDPCTATEVQLVDIIPMSPDQQLECFEGRSITFVAYVSGMIGIGGCTFDAIPGDGWLNLCIGPARILVATPGDEDGLGAFLPPTLDRQDVPTDSWMVVTGHFDDPAAASCDREEPTGPALDPEQAETCRRAFVLERAVPER